MKEEEFLYQAAQIAVALAAFSSLISLFQRDTQPLTRRTIEIIRFTMELGLSTAGLALLPILLAVTFNSEITAIRLASMIASIVLAFFLWQAQYETRTGLVKPTYPKLTNGIMIVSGGVIVVLLVNFFAAKTYLYLWTIYWLLVIGGIQFVLLLHNVKKEQFGEDTKAESNK